MDKHEGVIRNKLEGFSCEPCHARFYRLHDGGGFIDGAAESWNHHILGTIYCYFLSLIRVILSLKRSKYLSLLTIHQYQWWIDFKKPKQIESKNKRKNEKKTLLIKYSALKTSSDDFFASFKGIRIPGSEKLLLVESRILGFGIRNVAQGIRNLTEDWNPESSTRDPESTAWNPESKTALDSVTWGDLFLITAGLTLFKNDYTACRNQEDPTNNNNNNKRRTLMYS